MNYNEFAFFNQQLGSMLRDGLPLEGSIRQLTEQMARGECQTELERWSDDMAKGTPAMDALKGRRLPELYKRMVAVGVRSNDLPGTLKLVAEYYQETQNAWTRIKGMLTYPAIVLVVALGMAIVLPWVFRGVILSLGKELYEPAVLGSAPNSAFLAAFSFLASTFLFFTLLAAVLFLVVPPLRNWARWKIPPFREASIAQFAAGSANLLHQGATLDETLELMEQLEAGTPAGHDVQFWRQRLKSGMGEWLSPSPKPAFPEMFLWLVKSSRDDVTNGFRQAAEVYQARFQYRMDQVLHSILPTAVLCLGLLIFKLCLPWVGLIVQLLDRLGGLGGD